MTTLAEQVAEVQAGDYVRAEFVWDGHKEAVEGSVWVALGGNLVIGGKSFVAVELYRRNGELNSSLTSIHLVPRPIPSEPEVGSFALLDTGRVVQLEENEDETNWQLIYPHITRLYTPSGDEVTGFEYYNKGESK